MATRIPPNTPTSSTTALVLHNSRAVHLTNFAPARIVLSSGQEKKGSSMQHGFSFCEDDTILENGTILKTIKDIPIHQSMAYHWHLSVLKLSNL
jgi:hypothetical protein